MKRRIFIRNSIVGAAALATTPMFAYAGVQKELQISLAQWSLHRSFNDGTLDPVDFASIAKNQYNINACEYVNGFYHDKAKDEKFWNEMKERSLDVGVSNLVLMVDDEDRKGVGLRGLYRH